MSGSIRPGPALAISCCTVSLFTSCCDFTRNNDKKRTKHTKRLRFQLRVDAYTHQTKFGKGKLKLQVKYTRNLKKKGKQKGKKKGTHDVTEITVVRKRISGFLNLPSIGKCRLGRMPRGLQLLADTTNEQPHSTQRNALRHPSHRTLGWTKKKKTHHRTRFETRYYPQGWLLLLVLRQRGRRASCISVSPRATTL